MLPDVPISALYGGSAANSRYGGYSITSLYGDAATPPPFMGLCLGALRVSANPTVSGGFANPVVFKGSTKFIFYGGSANPAPGLFISILSRALATASYEEGSVIPTLSGGSVNSVLCKGTANPISMGALRTPP